MKKIIKYILPLITSSVLLSSCVIKQVQGQNRTVTVQGSGEIQLSADTATIVMAVITRNPDIIKATEENARKITDVMNAIYNDGIDRSNISTSNYRIYQETNSSGNDRNIQGPYNVSNEITIILTDVSRAGNIIDTAIKAGANNLSELTYSVSNTEEAVKQARMLAIKQAEENASVLASANGTSLGQLLYITEDSGSLYPRARSYKSSGEAALLKAATPIYSGNTSVTVCITACWELL